MVKKKKLLTLALALALLVSAVPTAAAADGMEASLALPSLREIYKDDFLLGAIFTPDNVTDRRLGLMERHFNALTAENVMKPNAFTESKGNYDFSFVDWLLESIPDFAIHGHVLAWHSQSAAWLNVGLNRSQAKANLEAYIKAVAGHFAGKLISWDVVNEAFTDGVGNPPSDWRDALRKDSAWYRAYANGASGQESGADYIYDAFVFARQTDPSAVLYYNDFNETMQGKREAIALMAEELNAQWESDPRNTEPGRLLIEGLGMQSHFFIDDLNVDDVEATIERFVETGCEVSVTELDIPAGNWMSMHSLNAETEKQQADLYARLFQIYKKYSENIARVTFWGLEDTASWRRQGEPLLFDGSFNAKPSFYAVADPDGFLEGLYNDPATRDAVLVETLKPETPPEEPEEPVTPEEPEEPDTSDMPEWARERLLAALEEGFVPEDLQSDYTQPILRGEYARLALNWLMKTTGKDAETLLAEYGSRNITFSDTDDADIVTAGNLGLVDGSDGKYNPLGTINRRQSARLICNVLAALGKDVTGAPAADFSDTADMPEWAIGAVNYVTHTGIMTGTDNEAKTFEPMQVYSRAQAIVTFYGLDT
ncbi:MAG: endo-1,4-beta-xylanase [Oscillospiraceae bacterium]|nr:endo-1,4-beta-xylanase [Oscillospiraceae bacterium]